jgi:diguanylate cyclase (GGDEF)-like protein
MAALAYDSARQRETLREQVKRDGLTGLLNHRACHERLHEELAGGRDVAVVMIDLDHFKVIIDAYGHAEGDRVLAAAAERLRSVVRASDVVGRLGGEEFVLILPGVDAEGAEDCADRARAALAELTVRGRPLAASAGVAAAPADGVEPSVLLGRPGRARRARGDRDGDRVDRPDRLRRPRARRPRGLPRAPPGLHRPRGRPRPRALAAVRRGDRPPHLNGVRPV